MAAGWAVSDSEKFANAPTSAFFGTTMATNYPTATPLVPKLIILTNLPSPNNIFAKNPSSYTSNPTVALSVSTSQMQSPADTGSPSFFNHFIIFPLSMVGDLNIMYNLQCRHG